MADIHGIPDASMMTPVQGFTSEPLPDVSGVTEAAGRLAGAGIVYPEGPRQAETRVLLDSAQGFSAGSGTSGYDILSGWSGEPDESWANNVQMPFLLETPVQGAGDYPGTIQDGLEKYGTS